MGRASFLLLLLSITVFESCKISHSLEGERVTYEIVFQFAKRAGSEDDFFKNAQFVEMSDGRQVNFYLLEDHLLSVLDNCAVPPKYIGGGMSIYDVDQYPRKKGELESHSGGDIYQLRYDSVTIQVRFLITLQSQSVIYSEKCSREISDEKNGCPVKWEHKGDDFIIFGDIINATSLSRQQIIARRLKVFERSYFTAYYCD